MKITRRTAADVADAIRGAGLPVTEVKEGAQEHDGSVAVSPSVHVQVPTFGGPMGVVVESKGKLRFLRLRDSIEEIIADLRAATTGEGA